MIISFIEKYGVASRKELDDLLMDKLSDVLSDKQKKVKVNNIVSSLRHGGKIKNTGSDRKSRWVLVKN